MVSRPFHGLFVVLFFFHNQNTMPIEMIIYYNILHIIYIYIYMYIYIYINYIYIL